MDADGNGAVTAAEIDETLRKALERYRNRILAALDADKDGSITKSRAHDRFWADGGPAPTATMTAA